MELNPDFVRLLREFEAVGARYLLVGAFAVDFHGQPRSARHMDIWLDDSSENMEAVYRALDKYGATSLFIEHLSAAPPLDVVWLGVPPYRIDMMKGLRGLTFADAWSSRMLADIGGVKAHVIGRDDLVIAKRSAGRDKDLADAAALAHP